MSDTPGPSEPATRRSKRPRVQTQRGVAQPRDDVIEDRSPNWEEREGSFDDFEDLPRHKQPKLKQATKDNLTLIEVIRGNGKIIPQLVKNWVERYEKYPKSAMVELLMTLFEACGAKYQIREDLLDETDVDDVVVALVTLAKKGEIEDRQNLKKKELKNFKDNLTYFWDNLVTECQNGPLFDQILFDKCMDYVIALSCTPPRSYRQVASLMGLQLVTSLISAAKMLGAQRETTQRQLNAERKKRADGPRVESLDKRLSETHEKITTIEEMMRKFFTGLFVHRYRDIDSEIRMSCIQSLGVWILSYPSLFLQDLYLKYLGWTLNDKDSGVRKASILALQNLYEVDDNVPSLGLFTERFSNRMIELADDSDISVAVCAIGLVKQLLRHQLIPDDDLGALYDLLIDDPPEIRHAIGELVYEHLIAQNFNSSQSRTAGDDNSSSEVHLSRMLQILREFSADQILSTYVIDDVWEYMEAMKDWKCIISMLLDENPQIVLTDEDATNLIRLLSASVKKAVGQKIVPAADNRKPHETKAQKDINDSNRRDITTSMMKRYPLLLRKFLSDKTKIAPLVDIIVHMNLELYSLKRQEQSFKSVIQLVKDAFFKHGDKDALRCCVTALSFYAGESQGELQDYAQNKLKEVENELITKLKSAIKEVEDGEDEYLLLVNSKRLYELQLSRSVPIENLFEDMAIFLQRFRNLDDEVVCFLLLNMYLQVAWFLHSIISSETVSETSLALLLSKRNNLLEHLEYYLGDPAGAHGEGKYGNELICRVCTILGEVWYLFRKSNYASTKLESLGYCPDESTLQKFWKLCEQKLYVSDETEDDDAHKEYVEETNREAVMISAAKLIASDVVPKGYLGPEVISHFVMHGSSVAEIVRHLISVLKKKEDNLSNIFHIFLEALKRAHYRHMVAVDSGVEPLSGKSFQDCKELAARLSGTIVGAARNKHRSDILKIVKDGVEFAFIDAPERLSFLESSVVQFVSKLPASDVLEILKDVESRTENVNTEVDPSGWRPYHTFVDILKEKYAKNEGAKEDNEGVTVKRRGRPRKNTNLQGRKLFDEQNSSEEEDSISVSDHEAQDVEEEEDDEAPLIHSIKSASKLRALKVKRDCLGQRKVGNSGETIDNQAASRT